MAQTGYTPILLYSSTTAAQAPAAGNLTNSTFGSELAINITDGKLFYKDNTNAVQVIAWKTTPTTAGGTGLTSYTAGDLTYYASGTTLTKLAIGASTTILTSSGTAPQWSAASGVTVGTATNLAGGVAGSVPYQTAAGTTAMLAIGVSGQWLGSSGTAPQWNSPAALTKTDDTNVTLTLGGSASTALLNAASLTLGWTGQLATSRGGTGLSSFSANQVFYASSTSAIGQSANLTFDGTTLTSGGYSTGGNLTFTGTGNRITGDFNNATLANRVLFQNSTTNDNTILGTIPNGTASISGFVAYSSSTPSNSSTLDLLVRTDASNAVQIRANRQGTGTFLPMAFFTNGSEAMRIDTSRNLLIGATSTQNNARLRVVGASTSGANYAVLVEDSGNTDIFYIRDDGEMYSLPTYNRTSGSASNVGIDAAGGFFRSTSSLKYKTDVQDATHGLAEVLQLRPVTYKGKNDGDTIFGGLIAEEVDAIGLTEFVQYAKDGSPDALAYGNMVSLLVKAIQELNAKVETQAIQIAELKSS